MKNRIKAPVLVVGAMIMLSGCNILDVLDPNSLIEESIKLEGASNGVVNGSQQLVARSVSEIWQLPSLASDEMYWIASRDAWGSLDHGFINDEENEFIDGAFPSLGQATWMAHNAVVIMTEHVGNNSGDDGFLLDLARAQMYKGIIYMITAEQQADMTFSDKQVDGPPVSSGSALIGSDPVANMDAVMGVAIASLTFAVNTFNSLSEDDFEHQALAVRARALHSRVIGANLTGAGGPLAFPLAAADAAAVLSDVAGSDWSYNFEYSSTSRSNSWAGWVNDRKENQFDLSLVTVETVSKAITGISLMDPVSGVADLALIHNIELWKGGAITIPGTEFSDLVVTSERLLNMIVAENELAGGNLGPFEDALNEVRDLDTAPNFTAGSAPGGFTDFQVLQHDRRVNTLVMGLRLQDMYRWSIIPGLTSDPAARWLPGSDALDRRGTLFPIAIVEVRANCHLNGTTCPDGG